ncbi:MAG: cell division protein FtsL [Myxococcales bacterium]|nr:cell division protein FtsL [Myxococcales bacterium]
MALFVFLILAGVAFLVAVSVYLSRHEAKQLQELEDAKRAYQAALQRLRVEKSTSARIAALERGREYAQIARVRAGQGGRVVFDELALQNDLTAFGSE